MIKIGSADVNGIYIGNTPVSKVYQGANLIWPNAPVWPDPEPLGTIFSDNFLRTSLGSDYVLETGGITVNTVMDGTTGLRLYDGDVAGQNTYNKTLRYKQQGTLEKFKITVECTVDRINSSGNSYGIGLGKHSTVTGGEKHIVSNFFCSTAIMGNYARTLFVNSAKNANIGPTSPTPMTLNLNDNVRLTFEVVFNTYTFTALNLTNGTSCVNSYNIPVGYGTTEYLANTAKYCIYMVGGDYKISLFKVESTENKYAHCAFIGDSITKCYFSDSAADRFAGKIKTASSRTNSHIVLAGPGNKTSDTLNTMDEIIMMMPKYAVLMIGVNDKGAGLSNAAYNTNLTSIVTQLKSEGITPIICAPIPNNHVDVSGYKTECQSVATAQSVKFIDTYTPLLGSGTGLNATYNSGDGTHPNNVGHDLIANTIMAAAPEIL